MAKYDLYGNLMEDETESNMFGLGKITDYLGNQSLGDITKFGGLALGTYDSLFGTGRKASKQQLNNLKSQGELLRQNIAANQYQMDKTKKFDEMMSKAGSGLGSINTTPLTA